MKNELQALFGGAEPTVKYYQRVLKDMPIGDSREFRKQTYGLALADWKNLNGSYQDFLVALIKSERQQFIDYVRNDTVLGEFLYDLQDTDLFQKIMNLLEKPSKKQKISYSRLAFSLLLAFNIPLKVKVLSDKIRYARIDTDELIDLYGRATIDNI